MKNSRIALILLLFITYSSLAMAQPYYLIAHCWTTKTINGNNVTTAKINNPICDNGSSAPCIDSGYFIGYQAINGVKFSFSIPPNRFRMRFSEGNTGEIIRFTINGSHYSITNSNISPVCSSSTASIASGGDYLVQGVPCGNSGHMDQVELRTGFLLGDSISVLHTNGVCNGGHMEFSFGYDTLVRIRPSYTDSIFCPGDSIKLPYDVTYHFRQGNVFTAQLSDSSGSFASPVNIGTRTDSLADTIKCRIPVSIIPGNHYRLRIVATNPVTISDSSSFNVLIKPLPAIPTASNNGPLCTGATLNLSAAGTAGASYSWTGPNSFNAGSQNPSRLSVTTADAGWYKVTANLNGCTAKDSANVVVRPVTPVPTAGSNSPVCVGGILNLTALTITGASYSWSATGFSSNLQNPSKINMQTSDAGTYTVIASVNGCPSAPSTTTVVVNTGPSVAAYASPSSTICTGASLAMVAVPNNVSTPTYQWYQNGNSINGATNVSYVSPAPGSGDVFYVMMTAGTACNTPISSNNITVTTLPTTPPPAATIAASPGTDVWPYLNVSFSISSLTNGGIAPTYQWKLNGQSVIGATQNKWNTTTLKDGDSVCLLVTSSDQCATPKSTLSNCLVMKVPAGVRPLNSLRGDLQVYPNPVSKELVIDGATVGTSIQINNIIGQTIYSGIINNRKEIINTSSWVPGAYVLHLTDNDGNKIIRKMVKD
jgi:hypothetical protein